MSNKKKGIGGVRLKGIIVFLMLLGAFFVRAQSTREIELGEKFWNQKEGTRAVFQEFKGRSAVQLDGALILKDLQMEEGVVSVDIYCTDERSFAGVFFHQSNGNREDVYLRQHKSNQADAVQYTPVFKAESNWQLYHKYQASVKFNPDQWNTIRVEYSRDQAEVFINHRRELTIDRLKGLSTNGHIGLWSLFPSWMSNVRISGKRPHLNGNPSSTTDIKKNYVNTWKISNSFSINDLDGKLNTKEPLHFKEASVDEDGLLAISKYVSKNSNGSFEKNVEDVVVVELEVISEVKTTKKISFDFSDRCIVTLDHSEIFRGDNSFRLKGVQYMGHLNAKANTLNLSLDKGKNVLRFWVIEKANGWGLKARFHDYDDLKTIPSQLGYE